MSTEASETSYDSQAYPWVSFKPLMSRYSLLGSPWVICATAYPDRLTIMTGKQAEKIYSFNIAKQFKLFLIVALAMFQICLNAERMSSERILALYTRAR